MFRLCWWGNFFWCGLALSGLYSFFIGFVCAIVINVDRFAMWLVMFSAKG